MCPGPGERADLDVQVGVGPGPSVGGPLGNSQEVRHGRVEQSVEPPEDVHEERGQAVRSQSTNDGRSARWPTGARVTANGHVAAGTHARHPTASAINRPSAVS